MAEPSPKKSPFPPKSLTDLPPDVVIDGILSRLPIRDAVRTSVLSRSWRHRWRSILDLTISLKNPDLAAVDHVLLFHSGPIRSFSLSIFIDPSSHRHHVALWLGLLSADPHRPLRSLTLDFDDAFPFFILPPIPLCPSLFSFHNLTRLDLRCCTFEDLSLTSLGFPVLEILNLALCTFPNFGSLSDLISNCPLLQKLELIDVEYSGLRIRSPNLRSFDFEGKLKDFPLVSAPLLTMMSILFFESDDELDDIVVVDDDDDDELDDYDELDDDDDDDVYLANKYNLIKALGDVRSIKKLELLDDSLYFLGKFGIPDRILDIFKRLQVLTLTVKFDSVKEISALLCLLRTAPNIQELYITPNHGEDNTEWDSSFWQTEDHLELSKLQILILSHVSRFGEELGFIDLVLPMALELKKMVIDIIAPSCKEHGSIDEPKSKELTEYWRASTRAEIIFTGIEKMKMTQISSTSKMDDAEDVTFQ